MGDREGTTGRTRSNWQSAISNQHSDRHFASCTPVVLHSCIRAFPHFNRVSPDPRPHLTTHSDTCRCSTTCRCNSSLASASRSSDATAPASRRCCRSSAANCRRTPASVWHEPALRVARLEQDVPLTSTKSIFDVVAEGLATCQDTTRTTGVVSTRSISSCRASTSTAVAGRHAVRRLATPRAAGSRAGGRAGCAAARRADQPSRHRCDFVAGELPGRLPRCRRVRDARPCLPAAPRHADRRTGSRTADVVARRLRDVRRRRRRSRWRTRRCSRRSSTRSSRRKRPGCVRASRRVARETRDACAR